MCLTVCLCSPQEHLGVIFGTPIEESQARSPSTSDRSSISAVATCLLSPSYKLRTGRFHGVFQEAACRFPLLASQRRFYSIFAHFFSKSLDPQCESFRLWLFCSDKCPPGRLELERWASCISRSLSCANLRVASMVVSFRVALECLRF